MIRPIAFRNTPQTQKKESPPQQTIWTGANMWNLKPEKVTNDTLVDNSPVGNAINFPGNLTGHNVTVNKKVLDVMLVLHPYITKAQGGKHMVFGDTTNPSTGIRTLKIMNSCGQIESINASAFDVVPQDTPNPKKFELKY